MKDDENRMIDMDNKEEVSERRRPEMLKWKSVVRVIVFGRLLLILFF